MDIKVGEYGRTNKGNIFIYANVVDEKGNKLDYIMKLVDGRPIKYYLSKDEQIVKHSFNIIDLIEVGDYVNGKRVSMLKGEVNLSDIDNENDFCYTNYSDEYGKWYGFREDEVKSILTHEQFEANCYKIEQK